MKSTLLVGTLAATLVSTLSAEVFVLGASWRERSLVAPDGVIERKMRNAAAPRGYVIMEPAAAPTLNGAFIEYNNDRVDGKTYTITLNFTGFTSDMVEDERGATNRIFGQILTPVTTADVPNAMMSFSGSTYGTNKPNRITFDKEVFQSGDSSTATPPNMVVGGDMKRSLLSGAARNFVTTSTTLADAVLVLEQRLIDEGYERNAVGPVILVDPVAPAQRIGFDTSKSLSVTLDPSTYSENGTTYAWFKEAGDTDTLVGTTAVFAIPGGPAGDGTYYVVVTNEAGSDTSTSVTIAASTPVLLQFTNAAPNNIQPPSPVNVPFAGTAVLSAPTNANALPQITGYQWQRSALTPISFVNVADGLGGKNPTLTVSGETSANTNGPGLYRVVITNGGTPPTITSSNATVATALP
ncbi:hypothetical protein [Luteolibacter sp. Populi]|uniref:hypothetical protein n=1 Tax=Luteolibacter sp. Populi TaxID=3230487 RepID=UPI00346532AA